MNALSEAIACDEPEKHPLFATSDQLTSDGYERIFTCYSKGTNRITNIIRQDILKLEKRNTKGRAKKDLVPFVLGKKATPNKKRKQETGTEEMERAVNDLAASRNDETHIVID